MKLSDLLNEINVPDTYRDAASHLTRNASYSGYGSGNFAQVVAKDDQPFVVKLFSRNDTAYLSYLNLITTHSSPHFPKIFSKIVLVKNKYYAVKIEKLDPLPKEMDHFVYDELWEFEDNIKYDFDKACSFDGKYPSLAKAIRLIYTDLIKKSENHVDFDMGSANIMLRGPTIVLTDPVNRTA